ncbi:hypothetical protein Tco_0286362 [Tanacetum coccineum]
MSTRRRRFGVISPIIQEVVAWVRTILARRKSAPACATSIVSGVTSIRTMDVAEVGADLLRARIVSTHATTSQIIGKITPHDDQIFYEINIANIPGHVGTLGRDHLYQYHLED